jgi:hypothetical protein
MQRRDPDIELGYLAISALPDSDDEETAVRLEKCREDMHHAGGDVERWLSMRNRRLAAEEQQKVQMSRSCHVQVQAVDLPAQQ